MKLVETVINDFDIRKVTEKMLLDVEGDLLLSVVQQSRRGTYTLENSLRWFRHQSVEFQVLSSWNSDDRFQHGMFLDIARAFDIVCMNERYVNYYKTGLSVSGSIRCKGEIRYLNNTRTNVCFVHRWQRDSIKTSKRAKWIWSWVQNEIHLIYTLLQRGSTIIFANV